MDLEDRAEEDRAEEDWVAEAMEVAGSAAVEEGEVDWVAAAMEAASSETVTEMVMVEAVLEAAAVGLVVAKAKAAVTAAGQDSH